MTETSKTRIEPAEATQTSGLWPLLSAMRPNHWVKNLVIFAAPMFAARFDWETFLLTFAAFCLFSLTASGFYLLNDMADLKQDRLHPIKYRRPLAAGLLSQPVALGSALFCIGLSLAVGFWMTPLLGYTLAAYCMLQTGYNLKLKHLAVIDIMCISAGFVLRALAGAAAAQVPPSSWFILCVGLLALYLAVKKRKAEIRELGHDTTTRVVLSQYSMAWLDSMESVITPSILMAYALWTIEGAKTSWMLATMPFVIYGLFKYQNLYNQGEGESPEILLFKSPALFITILLWVMTTVLILILSSNRMVSV
jgi:decaprenyl-phosphate phosphoribosyltransferase